MLCAAVLSRRADLLQLREMAAARTEGDSAAEGGTPSAWAPAGPSGGLQAGPLALQLQFNPDLYKMECMNDCAISLDGNKYFGGGVLTGVVGSALMPRSQIIYLRAAPFLVLGVAGIVADWWENSSACTEKTQAQFKAFLAAAKPEQK